MNIGRTVVLMCIVIPLMLVQSVAMSVLSLVLIPIVFYFAWHFFERIKTLFQEVEEAEGELTTIVQENLTGIRVVRAFARQTHECEKFEESNYRYSELNYRLISVLADFWSLSDLLCLAQSGILLIGGGWLVAHDQASMGTYFAFIGYTTILIWPIRQLGQELSEASKATVSIGRIQEILSVPEETDHGNSSGSSISFSGRITFDNLSFGYDANKPVLRNVSFDIASGETVAIVGPTGSGKSTLIRLLMRLYDYDQGSIQLDGHELCSIDRTTVRTHIGTLLQEPFLFSRSLRENIKFGSQHASDEQMVLSSRDASVHHTIQGFSKGYGTIIGERGVSLSGGQKQRVTLSRTLLQETPILVLDDTLSAVDAATERKIIQALHRKRGEQTLLIITHRISVCRQADRILVMQDGRLTAQGSHEKLIDQPGFYQDLWGIQSGQNTEFLRVLSNPAH
jgi:ATP-binding cassette subfamily B protein